MTDTPSRWLDPEIIAFLARTDSFYPDSANTASVAESRALYDRMCAAFRAPRPAGDAVADGVIAGVPTRRYRPPAPARAMLVYAHGGGFILGGRDSHDDVCAELCAGAAVDVVSVEYRLAPEHVYPAALDDMFAVVTALAAASDTLLVGGDSAGGRLAAAVCRRLRNRGLKQPAGQVLIYPGVSSDPLRVAGSRAATAPGLSATDCAYYGRMLAGGAVPRGDAEFAPLDAEDFACLAPAAIFAAGYDPLRQDAEDYAAVLHAACVPVSYRCDPGLVHGWLRARHSSRLAANAFAAVVRATSALAAGDVAALTG